MLASAPKAPNAVSKDAPVICTTPFGRISRKGCIHASHPLSRDVRHRLDRHRIRNGGFPRRHYTSTVTACQSKSNFHGALIIGAWKIFVKSNRISAISMKLSRYTPSKRFRQSPLARASPQPFFAAFRSFRGQRSVLMPRYTVRACPVMII